MKKITFFVLMSLVSILMVAQERGVPKNEVSPSLIIAFVVFVLVAILIWIIIAITRNYFKWVGTDVTDHIDNDESEVVGDNPYNYYQERYDFETGV